MGRSYGDGVPPVLANGLKSASVGYTPLLTFVTRLRISTPVSAAIMGSAETPLIIGRTSALAQGPRALGDCCGAASCVEAVPATGGPESSGDGPETPPARI